MEVKKCSFCKMQYRIGLLKSYPKNVYKGLGSFYVCKVCEKKVDVVKYQEELKDKYKINELRYANKISGIQKSPKELLELQLLNLKLKRELK